MKECLLPDFTVGNRIMAQYWEQLKYRWMKCRE